MDEKQLLQELCTLGYIVYTTGSQLIVTNKLKRAIPEFNFSENAPKPKLGGASRSQTETFSQQTDKGVGVYEFTTTMETCKRRALGKPVGRTNKVELKMQFDTFVKNAGVPFKCEGNSGSYIVATYSEEAGEYLDRYIQEYDYDTLCKAVRSYYSSNSDFKLTLKRLLVESLPALYNEYTTAIDEGRAFNPVLTNKTML